MADGAPRGLRRLARLYGVQTSYRDVFGRWRRATPDALLAVLKALGAPLETFRDVPEAMHERQAAVWKRICEPVAIAWDGRLGALELRLPASQAERRAAFRMELEDGGARRGELDMSAAATTGSAELDGVRFAAKKLDLDTALPLGLHRWTIEIGNTISETWVTSAPGRAYAPPGDERMWGAFLPLYSLHSERSWGLGDFTDLRRIAEWVAGLGGSVVGTLPLFATFLDEPFEPSPYAPVSRCFWNEIYLDATRIPELECSPPARALLASPEFQARRDALRRAMVVDYREAMRLKRQVLEELCRSFFAGSGERQRAFEQYVKDRPALEDYARFRATCEARRAGWPSWPERMQEGRLEAGDFEEHARRYHTYVQWLADEQLREIASAGRTNAAGLTLDLPLGVHPDGYDVWRERAVFARGVSAGAPPDAFFTRGQDWGFPPLHPERIREQGYRTYAACLRQPLRFARILRIDHVMGWHRLFWVPAGFEAADGVYVHYRAEEFHALAALESWRHKALIVGEDLGTVPREVPAAMRRHGLHRMYVAQYAAVPDRRRALGSLPKDAVASLNTHDMPTFAAFWEGRDITDRIGLGLLDEAQARIERSRRTALRHALVAFLERTGELAQRDRAPGEFRRRGPPTAQTVARAILGHLAASRVRAVIATLEDLWSETEPQNVPGTGHERPNWRRKARYPFEAFSRMPVVTEALAEIDQRRKPKTAGR